ncbi:BolA/IbaG family iron-sulfur metabolism protein [Suttonella ornithocola]|uniref:Predicted transcriptional regulator, BolA superfamily n=1 Tax=Suttonella ornithocola TaxID=279832 RepID=A0A380MWE7_9GAMM|nr:BolA/IbaG family iron-sulfur metabolism protein [Suttonella ornithocola]SUO96602.1 Predicted transcriptional regulator, BolA superfamily [Suttonella ornithocola]
MQEQLIESRIREALGENTEITLSTSDGVHYSATVISEAFAGHSRLEQHRMVMKALEDIISSNEVHALQLKTKVAE